MIGAPSRSPLLRVGQFVFDDSASASLRLEPRHRELGALFGVSSNLLNPTYLADRNSAHSTTLMSPRGRRPSSPPPDRLPVVHPRGHVNSPFAGAAMRPSAPATHVPRAVHVGDRFISAGTRPEPPSYAAGRRRALASPFSRRMIHFFACRPVVGVPTVSRGSNPLHRIFDPRIVVWIRHPRLRRFDFFSQYCSTVLCSFRLEFRVLRRIRVPPRQRPSRLALLLAAQQSPSQGFRRGSAVDVGGGS